jgi:eukaryotic-like serine/threonine-protein kinase
MDAAEGKSPHRSRIGERVEAAQPMTPQWFGDYEIVKRLRIGGMATLYLARRYGTAGFARLVALKMIHSHLAAQRTFIEMFVDEARICSQISHPNVVHVEEFGVIDGVHYLVMEYLDGCSLSELLMLHRRERRRLDPELAARIITQVAGGLHAAHEARGDDGQPLHVIHRDISPSNILLSRDGNPKLIDFGIAKAHNRLSETAAGVALKGKYSYVAPEQATGAAVDRRCDIFSLGVVFWELLAHRQLFPEDTYLALFNRVSRTEVVPPSRWNAAVPAAIDAIVLAMLQHEPAARPQTAIDVQRRIASAVPAAANRDPSELGALAVEVRDKRAARTPEALDGRDGLPRFSPTPRSLAATDGVQIELEGEATSARVPSTATDSSRASPRRWRKLQLGVAGVLGVAATVVGLVAHGGRTDDGNATAHRSLEVDGLMQPAAPDPDGESPPLPTTRAMSPDEIAASARATAAMTAISAMPAVAAPVPAPALATSSSPPARRSPGRVHVRARPTPPAGVEPARSSALPTRGAADSSAFSAVPFDDPGSGRVAPARPAAATPSAAPIIPEFDTSPEATP